MSFVCNQLATVKSYAFINSVCNQCEQKWLPYTGEQHGENCMELFESKTSISIIISHFA